ncbi:MAG: helix-turn-helix transcriptional regulator [Clostridia bacterium]|nr:helix-turn-helix transcriptional regulator [Clostridia bacterium]
MYEKNIYKAARQKAGKTQEAAAEALGISVESIKAYESYSRLPPSNIVDGMCIIYDAIYLAYQHNRIASGEIKIVPEVEVLDLPRAALRLINRVLEFAEKRQDRTLMQIAEDGVIDEDERPVFEAIVADLDDLIKAAMELKLSRQRDD